MLTLTRDGSAEIMVRLSSLLNPLPILEPWRSSVSGVRSVAREIFLAEDKSIHRILFNDVHIVLSW